MTDMRVIGMRDEDHEPTPPFRHSCGHIVISWGHLLEDANDDGGTGTEHDCPLGDDLSETAIEAVYADSARRVVHGTGKPGMTLCGHDARRDGRKPSPSAAIDCAGCLQLLKETAFTVVDECGIVASTPNAQEADMTPATAALAAPVADDALLENDHLDYGHATPIPGCPMCDPDHVPAELTDAEIIDEIKDEEGAAEAASYARTGRMSHAGHPHPQTKAGRAKCRRDMRKALATLRDQFNAN